MLYVPKPFVLEKCNSTNAYIQEHPKKFMVNFQAVRCQQQNLGKGRQNRSWQMLPQKDLALSMVYYPTIVSNIPSYTLTVGLAVVHALDSYIQSHFLKWPNDIWVGQAKLCGILIEQVQLNDRNALIIGVGINVNSPVKTLDFPNTSLLALTQKEIPLEELTNVLLQAMQIYLQEHRFPLEKEKVEMWNRRCRCIGQWVLVLGGIGAELTSINGQTKTNQTKNFLEEFSATVLGIDEYGRLLVQRQNQNIALHEAHIRLLSFAN